MSDTMNDIWEKAKELGGKAVVKTKEAAQTGTAKATILSKKGDIRDLYTRVGEYFYVHKDSLGSDDTLDNLCSEIDQINEEIDELSNKMELNKTADEDAGTPEPEGPVEKMEAEVVDDPDKTE